jgi:hypothetical protein
MRFPLACLVVMPLVVGLASCGDEAPASSPDVTTVVQSSQDAGAVDPAHCADLDECACAQTPECAPLTTDCWCPPAACGGAAACACTGGRFIGCNPRGTHCASSQCALLAAPSVRDQQACMACADPTDCATAVAELPSVCPGMLAADAQWICDGSYGPCAAFCVASLRTCAAAQCALCPDCSCGDDLFTSCLYECLNAAQNRH